MPYLKWIGHVEGPKLNAAVFEVLSSAPPPSPLEVEGEAGELEDG